MMALRFRKGKRFWLSLVMSLVIVGTLCALGAWQVQRLAWKTALIAALNNPDAALTATNLPAVSVSPSNPEPVLFFGHYRPEFSIMVRNEDRLAVYMPFETSDGAVILMRRGTIPAQKIAGLVLDRDKRPGEISVVGVPLPKPPFIPMMHEPAPQGLVWTLLDWKAIKTKFGGQRLMPYMVAVLGEPEGPLPLTHAAPELRNEHLQYAIFWFGMAIIAAWLFGRFLLFAPRREEI